MAEKRFAIVFSGRIVDGADEAQVRKNLANLFNVKAKKIDAMFSGKPVLIKKDMEETKARGYQAAFAKAGAVVELAATKTPNQATSAPPGAAKSQPDAKPERTPNPTAAQHDESPPAPPQAPDLTIAEVGVTIIEHKPVPPAEFDTTQFDLAEIGATLVEYEVVPPPNFDLSGIELAAAGVQLVEYKKTPPAEFDTSALSLSENQ